MLATGEGLAAADLFMGDCISIRKNKKSVPLATVEHTSSRVQIWLALPLQVLASPGDEIALSYALI